MTNFEYTYQIIDSERVLQIRTSEHPFTIQFIFSNEIEEHQDLIKLFDADSEKIKKYIVYLLEEPTRQFNVEEIKNAIE